MRLPPHPGCLTLPRPARRDGDRADVRPSAGKLPETPAACGFVELLDDTGPSVLDDLYCEAIDLLDAHYVAQRASYMDFPKIIKARGLPRWTRPS